MLTRLVINNLYGLYDYDLNLSSSPSDKIRFITAPNGYGKTTILSLIDGLYNRHFEIFFRVNFQRITFYIDEAEVELKQSVESVREASEDAPDKKTISITFGNNEHAHVYKLSEDDVLNNGESADIQDVLMEVELFFSSEHCKYVTDRRLLEKNFGSAELVKLAAGLKERLQKTESVLTFLIQIAIDSMSGGNDIQVSQELYQQAADLLDEYHNLGLLNAVNLPQTLEGEDANRIIAIRNTLSNPDMFIQQLRVLWRIAQRSEFTNKKFLLGSQFGFRFVATDEQKTKIDMASLSSGEKHIMLQAMYLLFEAKEKALVLVDEPEMSFHLAWQGDYLKNLMEIVKLRNVQCIISTHSPYIFDMEYGRSIDLYKITHIDYDRSTE